MLLYNQVKLASFIFSFCSKLKFKAHDCSSYCLAIMSDGNKTKVYVSNKMNGNWIGSRWSRTCNVECICFVSSVALRKPPTDGKLRGSIIFTVTTNLGYVKCNLMEFYICFSLLNIIEKSEKNANMSLSMLHYFLHLKWMRINSDSKFQPTT